MKKKIILSSILTIALCVALIAGSTFALFTSESKVNIAVTAGKVDVKATIDSASLKTYSMDVEQAVGTFENGGTAVIDDATATLNLELVTPGDKATFEIDVVNTSNVEFQYRFKWVVDGELAGGLVATVDDAALTSNATDWAVWDKGDGYTMKVAVELPVEAGNEYQGKTAAISFTIEAVQGNGTAYFKEPVKDAAEITEMLANGKNVILADDIVTEAATAAPYGNKYTFKLDGGVIDGNGHELYMECYGDHYGIMTSGGTVKNVTIKEGCRAIMIMYPTQDVILDNVNIGGDGVLYPINTGEAGSAGVKLIVTNSTLAGWTSFSNIESASFTNVKFEQGTYYNNIYGRVFKPYVNTTLTDCSFVEHMNLDLSGLAEGQKITFTNCTVNGQAVTEGVFTIPTTDAQYDTELFTIDLPSWATSIADCVVFN